MTIVEEIIKDFTEMSKKGGDAGFVGRSVLAIIENKQYLEKEKQQNLSLSLNNKDTNDNWETNDFLHGIEVLLSEKPKEKSLLKAAEELNELSLKLLHFVNKPDSVDKGSIEEEISDCEMNFHVLKAYFPVSENIRKSKIEKFLQSKDYKFYEASYKAKH